MARAMRMRRLAERVWPISPRLALKLMDRRGNHHYQRALRNRSSMVSKPDELAELLPEVDRERLLALLQRQGRSESRSRLIKTISDRRGIQKIARFVEADERSRALITELKKGGKGAIVTTWHAGPTPAIWCFLANQGISIAKAQNRRWEVEPKGWKIIIRKFEPGEGLRLLHEFRRLLRQDKWIGFAFDHKEETARTFRMEVLGAGIEYPVGIAALSCMTGAPVVPVTAVWDEKKPLMRVEVQEPIHPPLEDGNGYEEAEAFIMSELGRRTEEYIRRYPWEVSRRLVRTLLKAGKSQ